MEKREGEAIRLTAKCTVVVTQSIYELPPVSNCSQLKFDFPARNTITKSFESFPELLARGT